MKKSLWTTTALVCLCFNLPACAACDKTGDIEDENCWECGKNCTARLSENGHMTISGTGEMFAMQTADKVPWKGKKSLITSVTIEEGITTIQQYVFNSCKNLTSAEIPASVTFIGSDAFGSTSALSNIVFADKSKLTTIGTWAFSNSPTEELKLPDSVQSIGHRALAAMPNLESIKLPDSLKSIPSALFTGCKNLKTVIIPENVTSIKSDSFHDLKNLQNVYCAKSQLDNGLCVSDLFNGVTPGYYVKGKHKTSSFDQNGKYLETVYDHKVRKIYTLEEAMEATKNGDKFHVSLTYK